MNDRVVLDTHVLIWLLDGDRRLSPHAVQAIEQARTDGRVYVSAITPWEVAMLVAKGRLALAHDVQEWIDAALGQPGVTLVPLSPAIAVASTRLPGVIHGDPADRIIVATARHHEACLVTADEHVLAYGSAGHVTTLHAVSPHVET